MILKALILVPLLAMATTAAPSAGPDGLTRRSNSLCTFSARVEQVCPIITIDNIPQLTTALTIPEILSSKGQLIVKPNCGHPFPLSQYPYAIGVNGEFGKLYASWNDNVVGRNEKDNSAGLVRYSYNGCD
jgi:hypothetical protein